MTTRSTALAPAPLAPASSLTHAPARAEVAVNGDARRWFALAIGSLVIAGLLSLAVVIGRLPVIAQLIGDPLFFKRCLVVHVDLALVVWFYAFLGGLSAMRAGPAGFVGRAAFALSVGGVGAMLSGALMRGAEPVLANYVPVIDHPVFLGGLAAFFLGAILFFLEALGTAAARRPAGMPADTAIGLQAAALAFVLAGTTWLATRAALPEGLDTWTNYEFSAWGAGHVLQVANAAAMISVWLWLAARATGTPVRSARLARGLFTRLVAPHFAMPLLTAHGAMNPLYHSGATQLMRWGIFPIVVAVLALTRRHLRRDARSLDSMANVARDGFAASAILTVLGFALGACIRTSTTLVPAHYHASLGGVTVAFMAAAYLVCHAVRGGLPAATIRRARRQLVLFGIGQSVFALGFALGGAYGLGRKTYGAEQQVRSAGEYLGLGVMGVGGLVATAGGLWFLFLVVREMRSWVKAGPTISASTL